jgi:hypothetical protein
MWVMEGDALRRRQVRTTAELPLVGQFSPAHPVTLTRTEKAAANIPEDAGEFCWSYPVADWNAVAGDDAPRSFLAVGGYVYFARGAVCGCTTLIPAEAGGLQFGAPKPWHPSWTQALMKQGRIQPITIQALREVGAMHFCWLRPGEQLELEGPLADQPQVEHGGFCYFFHEDVYCKDDAQLALDRYFAIKSGEEYEPSEQQAPRAFFALAELSALHELRDQVATAANAGEVARMQAEIGRLEVQLGAATRCAVCQDAPKDTLFNCGHVCSCAECAARLRSCPLCRAPITERRRALA